MIRTYFITLLISSIFVPYGQASSSQDSPDELNRLQNPTRLSTNLSFQQVTSGNSKNAFVGYGGVLDTYHSENSMSVASAASSSDSSSTSKRNQKFLGTRGFSDFSENQPREESVSKKARNNEATCNGLIKAIEGADKILNDWKIIDKVNIIIGNTGSGKSTIFSYLLGYPLIAMHKPQTKMVILERENNKIISEALGEKGKIYHGTISGTTHPQRVGHYFDCPGFADTRGGSQEIINSYSLYKLFEKVSSFRLLITVSNGELYETKGQSFFALIKQIGNLFHNDIDKIKEGITVIITKHAEEKEEILQNEIKVRFQEILADNEDNEEFNDFQREFITYFMDHIERISFFNMPQNVGEKIRSGIDLTKGTSFITGINPCITLSPRTQLFTKKLAEKINKDLSEVIANFYEQLTKKKENSLIINLLKGINNASDARKNFSRIIDQLKRLEDDNDIDQNKETFSEIIKTFNSPLNDNFLELIERLKFFKLIDPASVDYRGLDSSQLKLIITYLLPFSTSPVIIKSENSLYIKGYIIGTRDIPSDINSIAQLMIFAKEHLIIDGDITLPGTNIVFKSPYWSIINNRFINLRGRDGVAVSTHKAIRAQDGKPGLPGQTGGSFYGIVNDIKRKGNLEINTNGGNGGPGQDGTVARNCRFF